MIDDLKKEATDRMSKSIDNLKQELSKLRTGRAHASLLDHVMVSYYGSDAPLNQVASVG
ncbi:MAG TPA: ribosome recycling factor, partial [Candidatus Competibacter sp.]|nr:ribosome recycling factor [Candidatus Competibacter sp.]